MFKTIWIPLEIYEKELNRYYLLAETIEGMAMVLDKTLSCNTDQIILLQKTKDNLTYPYEKSTSSKSSN